MGYLAESCGVSTTYLTRVFGEQMREAPMQCLQRYRLSIVCSLLLRSRLPIRVVASQVGYTDTNYFTRVFTKYLQVSSGAYRMKKTPFSMWRCQG